MTKTTMQDLKLSLIAGCLSLLTIIFAGSARAATLVPIGPLNLSHGSNVIQNGSFEDHPDGGVTAHYWATGTSGTPFASPANWVTNGAAPNYALWGNTALGGIGINTPALPDGKSALYFGNQLLSAISETPTFNANGTVSFTSTPVIVPAIGYSPPVTLSQTLTGLTPNATYGLSFWASGENAGDGQGFNHDGIFALDVSGYNTTYLAAPSGYSGLGQSHVYNFAFVPTSSTATITFTNWGHPMSATVGWTLGGFATELVLDDVIVNPIPEPNSLVLFGLGALCLFRFGRRRLKN